MLRLVWIAVDFAQLCDGWGHTNPLGFDDVLCVRAIKIILEGFPELSSSHGTQSHIDIMTFATK